MISTRFILGLTAAFGLVGCGAQTDDGPPNIRYGDSICTECGMIVSDERFATATIVVGDRGNEPLVFDDFNCQIIFESKHPELEIVDRWSHDHGTREWIHMSDAWYVRSGELRTPMASNTASFGNKADAEALAKLLNGRVVDHSAMMHSD